MREKLIQYRFLFEELVKRDFKKKYKRTVLGMVWSILSPLLTLLVMKLVFTQFFGRSTPHYTTYLFCGNLIFSCFNESASQGMTSLMGNAAIFTKVNVPKYLFLFSKNVQTLINFGLSLCVFFLFCILDNIIYVEIHPPALPHCLLGAVQYRGWFGFIRSVRVFPGHPIFMVCIYPTFDVHVSHFLYN